MQHNVYNFFCRLMLTIASAIADTCLISKLFPSRRLRFHPRFQAFNISIISISCRVLTRQSLINCKIDLFDYIHIKDHID